MPYLLEDLIIDRVDLVDEGANSAAFISLYKRKEQSNMDVKEIIAKLAPEHAEVVQAELDRLDGEVTKANETIGTMTSEHGEAITELNTQLEKAQGDLATAQNELAAEVAKSKTEEGTQTDEELLKSMPEAARELFTKMRAQKEAAEESVRKAKEAEEEAEAVAKAAKLQALPVEQEKLVELVKSCPAEVLELLTTVNDAMDGVVLGEVGKNKGTGAADAGTEAWGKIEAKATELAKSTNISKAKAISQVIDENPDLYRDYLEGGAN